MHLSCIIIRQILHILWEVHFSKCNHKKFLKIAFSTQLFHQQWFRIVTYMDITPRKCQHSIEINPVIGQIVQWPVNLAHCFGFSKFKLLIQTINDKSDTFAFDLSWLLATTKKQLAAQTERIKSNKFYQLPCFTCNLKLLFLQRNLDIFSFAWVIFGRKQMEVSQLSWYWSLWWLPWWNCSLLALYGGACTIVKATQTSLVRVLQSSSHGSWFI